MKATKFGIVFITWLSAQNRHDSTMTDGAPVWDIEAGMLEATGIVFQMQCTRLTRKEKTINFSDE